MRSVRCDVCGTKALMAASKCPKCGHGFEVRDGFGELLPLAHCASCDSYYPQHLGSCRWCGTKPERSQIGPYVWKGLGIATFVAMAIGAWLVRDDAQAKKAPARTFVADTLPTNQPKAESFGRKVAVHQDSAADAAPESTTTVAQADSVPATTVPIGSLDTAQPTPTPVVSEPVVLQSAGTVAPVDAAPAADTPRADPLPAPPAAPRVAAATRADNIVIDRPAAPVPEKARPRALARVPERASPRTPARSPSRVIAKAPARVAPVPKATPKSKSSSRWVTSVARSWTVVRSDPSRQARIIAAIGPNTRVQLGETRGAWRRIKTKGLAGWVEHRALVARLSTPKKAGRLAAR